MMDIVERLRGDYSDERLEIAADEIVRLRKQVKYFYENGLKKDVEIERLTAELKESE
jgi:hypothetical protein